MLLEVRGPGKASLWLGVSGCRLSTRDCTDLSIQHPGCTPIRKILYSGCCESGRRACRDSQVLSLVLSLSVGQCAVAYHRPGNHFIQRSFESMEVTSDTLRKYVDLNQVQMQNERALLYLTHPSSLCDPHTWVMHMCRSSSGGSCDSGGDIVAVSA